MLLVAEPKGAMVSLSTPLRSALLFLAVLPLASCASTYAVTDAACVVSCHEMLRDSQVLVWSSDPALEPLLLDWARDRGARVVDPVLVQEAIRQHQLELEPKPGLEDALRHLGHLVGADHILVAAVMPRSRPLYVMYSGYTEGHPKVTTLFDPMVAVRSLGVDPPTVDWSIVATGEAPTFVLAPAVAELTEVALRRASCEADEESRWTDTTGCVRKP